MAIADENGLDGRALLAATEDEAVKAEYQANTDEAVALGVFGAPTYIYEGEMFWGQDRLLMLEWRLTQKAGSDLSRIQFRITSGRSLPNHWEILVFRSREPKTELANDQALGCQCLEY